MSLAQTAKLKKKNAAELKRLRALSKSCEERISAGFATTDTFADRDHLRDQIRALSAPPRTIADGLDQHAYELGQRHEISSAAFYKRWKPRSAAQWIAKLWRADWTDPSKPVWDPSGAAETDPAKMADEITKYYKQLYARKTTHKAAANRALDALSAGDQVSDPTKASLAALISKEEISSVCNHLPTGKSPGPDRIPNKFYMTFAKIIAPLLEKVYEESRQRGFLPPSMRRGIISMMYKKKHREDARNYRPITLLNCDYKIMMRILAERMNLAVVQFVSKDQNGFVPDGFIAENTMRLKLLQNLIEDENSEAIFFHRQ